MTSVPTKKCLIVIVCLSVLTFVSPVHALSKTSCTTIKGDEFCFEMNTPDRNNWTWKETWSLGTPYKKHYNDTIKVKIIIFGGYWSCNPRFSKVTTYQEKDEYGRLIILGKGELKNGIFGKEKALKNRMQSACK